MIATKKLRTLNLELPTRKGRIAAITAASGLVVVKDFIYVIADDENHLAVFGLKGHAPGKTVRLFSGSLPHSKKRRKKKKPDLEILTHLSPREYPRNGALLAIPSGSKANRHRGCLLELGARGEIVGAPEPLDFRTVFDPLSRIFAEFNLEAAVIRRSEIWLFHRGHQAAPINYIIKIPLKSFLRSVRYGKKLAPSDIALGPQFLIPARNGMHYTITDAVEIDSRNIMFTAAAESSDDSINDGPHGGSVIGIINPRGQISFLDRATPRKKFEGISVVGTANKRKLLLVNDEDDPDVPSELREAPFPTH